MVNFKVHKLQNNNCKKPEYLLFIMHGYGDSGGGILHAFNDLSERFENFLLIAPDGSMPHPYSDGYEWFNLDGVNESQKKAVEIFANGVNEVLYLHEFIDSEVKKYDIDYSKVFLAGFSQGAFIVNHLALTSKHNFAGLISISGGASTIALEKTGVHPKEITTPFCLLHGEEDSVLPASISRVSSMFLKDNNIQNELHIIPNTEHTINRQMMEIIFNFIEENL